MADDNNNADKPKKIRIAPEELEIGDEEGFENHDIFGYEKFGNVLANIFQRTLGLRVFLLDDEWGSGKTVFVKQWAGVMRHRKAKVIYIDAFENDYQTDPFLMIMSEMNLALGGRGQEPNFFDASVKALASTADRSLNLVTNGIVNLKEIFEAYERTLSQSEKEKNDLQGFRQALRGLADNSGNLIVIVDELDRCRPDFALRLLERVKHLFDVEGISFLLVASSATLVQMVRHAYGFNEPQAIRYLEKFIDLRNSLPKSLEGRRGSRQQAYTERLANISKEDDAYSESQYGIYESLGVIAKLCDLELRTIEKIHFNFIAVCVQENFDLGLRNFVISLCLIKTVAPEQFRQILESGKCDWDSLENILKLRYVDPKLKKEHKYGHIFYIIEALFITFDQLKLISQTRENWYAEEAATRGFSVRGGRFSREQMAKRIAEIINENTSFS